MMGGSLAELEARLAQLDEQRIDVHAVDTESIELVVEYFVLAAAYINYRTVEDAGGTLGVKSEKVGKIPLVDATG